MTRRSAASKAASVLGRRGGKARAKALTPERQSEIGRLAIRARWAKVRAAKVINLPSDARVSSIIAPAVMCDGKPPVTLGEMAAQS